MKPFRAVAFAVTLSFAVAQAQPVARVVDLPVPQPTAETTLARTISADLLRQPLSRKAKQILEKAQHAADAGDHPGAIGFLETALAKYPESAAWTQSMLGVEYLKTNRFTAAVTALEEAVLLLPRDAVDHANLGFALASTGQYDRAERELRLAIALDKSNLTTKQLLDVVLAANVRQPPAQPEINTASSR
jgi:tetratricopeptide (TPR) repeat protein